MTQPIRVLLVDDKEDYCKSLSGTARNKNIQINIRRRLYWQDRYLLILSAVLLGLLLLASATAQADESWGMQFTQNDQLTDSHA